MKCSGHKPRRGLAPGRLARADRRLQLLDNARRIVREEGADGLTMGRLASRAGVTKPVVYDHFGTRSGLLIDLYRWIDMETVAGFEAAMASEPVGPAQTVERLSIAYVECAARTEGEFQAVGAALAGSPEKARVFEELLANSVRMFTAVLGPHSGLDSADLARRCVGLVGAGEALAAAVVRGRLAHEEAVQALIVIIRGALDERPGGAEPG